MCQFVQRMRSHPIPISRSWKMQPDDFDIPADFARVEQAAMINQTFIALLP